MRYLKGLLFLPVLLFTPFLEAKASPWIDLPGEPLSTLSKMEESCFCEIDQLIKEYHQLPKTEGALLEKRISFLEEIKTYILGCAEQVVHPKSVAFLTNLALLAEGKQSYLEELSELVAILEKNPNYSNTLCNCIPSCNPSWKPLYLIHERHYDAARGTFWGEYQYEILDPCHRRLTTYHDLWKQISGGSGNFASFLLWLETQNLSEEVISIHFFTQDEIENANVYCMNGKLYFKKSGELISEDGVKREYLFTIDLDEEMYIAIGSNEIRHNSLSMGRPVLGAGKLGIQEGKVVSIDFQSGHYLPEPADGLQMLKLFKKKSIPLQQRTPVLFYTGRDRHLLTLEEFLSVYSN